MRRKLIALVLLLTLVVAGTLAFAKYKANQKSNANLTPTSVLSANDTTPIVDDNTPSDGKFQSPMQFANYEKFSLNFPSEWHKVYTEIPDGGYTLRLQKNGYQINIMSIQGDKVPCIFSGDFQANQVGIDLRKTENHEVSNSMINFRYYANPAKSQNGTKTFLFCAKQADSSYANITAIGIINYVVPEKHEQSMLTEMDQILMSVALPQGE